MKHIKHSLAAIAAVGSFLLCPLISAAQTTPYTDAAKADVAYTEAEVKRIDMSTGKITLKHGAIQNLDMPPMTMVFTVKDKGLLNDIAVGDQVRFKATSDGAKIVITELRK